MKVNEQANFADMATLKRLTAGTAAELDARIECKNHLLRS